MITNFDQLCAELEKQELESSSGVSSCAVYAQLLSVYLYQNDLCNAKFLWKRIPPSIITSNPEITAIWLIGQKLWKKDLPATYIALAGFKWSEHVAHIIRALEDKVRERAFNLIGKSYSSISLDTMISMTGLSKDAAIQCCNQRKWTISEDGKIISPAPSKLPTTLHTSSEDQLFKLTEFVTFLEN